MPAPVQSLVEPDLRVGLESGKNTVRENRTTREVAVPKGWARTSFAGKSLSPWAMRIRAGVLKIHMR